MKIINRYICETTSAYASDDVKNKITRHGTNNLSDAELLSVFISNEVKNETRLKLAQDMLKYVGSIGAITEMALEEFTEFEGFDKSSFVNFKAAIELDRRRLFVETTKKDVITSPGDLTDLLRRHIGSSKTEVFGIVFLNTKMEVQEIIDVQSGTIDAAAIVPRELVKHCLRINSKFVLLYHSHPSGTLVESDADRRITIKIQKALELFEVSVRDHVIITENGSVSFAEKGLI